MRKPKASLTVPDALDDVDNQNVKYNRRLKRRRGKQRSVAISPAVFSGLSLIFLTLFGTWQYTIRQAAQRAYDERLEHHKQAERMFQERNYDAKHFSDGPSSQRMEHAFAEERLHGKETGEEPLIRKILKAWRTELDHDIVNNVHGGIRWSRPYLLPPLPGSQVTPEKAHRHRTDEKALHSGYFRVQRSGMHMAWQDEWNVLSPEQKALGPPVDYTPRDKYIYPELVMEPPSNGEYPPLRTMQDIMTEWHQDEDKEGVIQEYLLHFNYSNPTERQAATRYRDAKLPFKVYNVPEIDAASVKWTDEYLGKQFGGINHARMFSGGMYASGNAQESVNNYFAFFVPKMWNLETMGLTPTRNSDWSFSEWAAHARYADVAALSADQPHFYWQSGVPASERFHEPDMQTFITKDLPTFSAKEENFFLFHPEEQKGIQCRFGERQVVAATHFDGGQNMVAMVTGAKRYILSPPRQCSRLGIFASEKQSPIYRHSLLNFGHLNNMDDEDMSSEERAWLERASSGLSVETVLKRGEVLFIPSHWFHYIISVQKSGQCNVRSGIEEEGTKQFGGQKDVIQCKDNI